MSLLLIYICRHTRGFICLEEEDKCEIRWRCVEYSNCCVLGSFFPSFVHCTPNINSYSIDDLYVHNNQGITRDSCDFFEFLDSMTDSVRCLDNNITEINI